MPPEVRDDASADAATPRWRSRAGLLRLGSLLVRPLLAGLAIWLVWHELSSLDVHVLRDAMRGASPAEIALGVAVALATVGVMGLYDVFAFRGPELRAARRWQIGALVLAQTNLLTLGPIGGPAIRLYLYRRAGMDTKRFMACLAGLYLGIYAGLAAWLAAAFAPFGDSTAALVARIALAAALAPALSLLVGRMLPMLRSGDSARSRPALARLGLVGFADWLGMLTCFTIVGRAVGVQVEPLAHARALFVGQAAGFLSMLPGGLGAADAIWLKSLVAAGASADLAGAQIVLFRGVFYLTPWLVSLVALYLIFAGRSVAAARWQRRLLAGAVALNAVLLLLSSATPAVRHRLDAVARALPLGAIEASHLTAVLTAGVMLFLVRGLLRGYRAAFWATAAALAASVVAHAMKGGDYEEAIASAVLLLVLLALRGAFPRRGRVPIGWEVALAAGAGSMAFFLVAGLASFSKLPYTQALWTTFAPTAEGARFLRGAAALGALIAIFMLREAVHPERRWATASGETIDRAVRAIRASADRSEALLVATGDKGVWFWDGGKAGEGLAVYQVVGDRMVVLADPIAPRGRETELLRALHEHAEREDLDPTFYEVSGPWLERLHSFGHSFFKLGEEAVVPLSGFTMEGGSRANWRRIVRTVEAQGITFRVSDPAPSEEEIEQAALVSDAWLAHKGVREMQFSLGYFSREYMRRFPMAGAYDSDGRLVAFVNLLLTRPGGEASFDFMRYRSGVADGLMDSVIIRSIGWCAGQGYASLSLGMAPLAEVGAERRGPVMERAAALAFRHAERIYNYRGLHAYKSKFHPAWEPRFLAYQRPWDLFGALWSVSSLVGARSSRARARIHAAREAR